MGVGCGVDVGWMWGGCQLGLICGQHKCYVSLSFTPSPSTSSPPRTCFSFYFVFLIQNPNPSVIWEVHLTKRKAFLPELLQTLYKKDPGSYLVENTIHLNYEDGPVDVDLVNNSSLCGESHQAHKCRMWAKWTNLSVPRCSQRSNQRIFFFAETSGCHVNSDARPESSNVECSGIKVRAAHCYKLWFNQILRFVASASLYNLFCCQCIPV